jgi:hypothetical protein
MKKQHCMATLLTFFLNKNISIHFTMGKKEEENFAYSLIINWWSINYPFLLRQG